MPEPLNRPWGENNVPYNTRNTTELANSLANKLIEKLFPRTCGMGDAVDWKQSGLDQAIRGLRLPIDERGQLIAIPTVPFNFNGTNSTNQTTITLTPQETLIVTTPIQTMDDLNLTMSILSHPTDIILKSIFIQYYPTSLALGGNFLLGDTAYGDLMNFFAVPQTGVGPETVTIDKQFSGTRLGAGGLTYIFLSTAGTSVEITATLEYYIP